MPALIDTHIFIHMLTAPERLSPPQLAAIDDPDNDLFFSLASVWEITIKYGLGKLHLPAPPDVLFPAQLDALNVKLLPLAIADVLQVQYLPPHHQDPFDRLIIAQAKLHHLPVISSDRHFPSYNIQLIV